MAFASESVRLATDAVSRRENATGRTSARVVRQTTLSVCLGMIVYLCRIQTLLLMATRERKRSQEKNYPKGYAEMLEQQQAQLVSALTEMYHQLRRASAWEGPSLDESGGDPSAHDILSALDLLEVDRKLDEVQLFEEEYDKRQFKMTLDHASIARRRLRVHTISEVADRCQEGPVATSSFDCKPVQSNPSLFTQSFDQPSVTSSVVTQSTTSSWEASLHLPNAEASVVTCTTLQGSPTFRNERRASILEWEHALIKMNETVQAYRDDANAFGASDGPWDSAPVPLAEHQDLLTSDNACSMLGTNDLFSFNWIPCDPNDFVWQPEMAAWAT